VILLPTLGFVVVSVDSITTQFDWVLLRFKKWVSDVQAEG
jgi:hypothetical protein